MPSSPKIKKEMILKSALDLVKNNGYESLNIKELARKIGCSTQPISWHFQNMEGLRNSLAEYARSYANEKLISTSDQPLQVFEETGISYIRMAKEEPNLFRFLYLNGYKGQCAGNFNALTSDKTHRELVKNIANFFQFSTSMAEKYVQNTIIYTHGIASLIATGVIETTIEEAMRLVNKTADLFLLDAGILEVNIPQHKMG